MSQLDANLGLTPEAAGCLSVAESSLGDVEKGKDESPCRLEFTGLVMAAEPG